jgi:hypothetical protein
MKYVIHISDNLLIVTDFKILIILICAISNVTVGIFIKPTK